MYSRVLPVLAAILVLALAGTVTAQSDGDVIFEADFQSFDIPEGLLVEGEWTQLGEEGNGYYRGTGDGWDDFLFIETGDEWADYAYEADVRINSGQAYMDFRSQGRGCNVYELVIDPTEDYLGLLVIEQGEDENGSTTCSTIETLDTDDDFDFGFGLWTSIRIEVAGNEISVIMDGMEVLSGTDSNSTYEEGTIQFWVGQDSEVDVDNLRISALGEGDQGSGGSLADSIRNNNGSGTGTVSLSAYAASHQEASKELENLGLVPGGGTLLFYEDYAWFSGRGNWFTPLAARSPRTDIVMAGMMTFETGATDEIEICALDSRIQMQGRTAVIDLKVGLVNDGRVVVIDRSVANGDPTTVEVADITLDYSTPHHLMMLVIGRELTVFIDGEVVFDQLPVVQREGTFGISLSGVTSSTRCEGRDIWVYQYD